MGSELDSVQRNRVLHTATLPNEKMLRNEIDDFWYHALWTAKKLRRGELLTAKECLDGYMKGLFFRMVRTLARAAKGPDYDTWHQVRFFEEWADGETLEALPLLYARYDATDMARALEATMAQYSRVARKACELLGYSYPVESEETIKSLVAKVLKG
ncbi:MAG: aminoglycoside 6-adenylyltransferase [Bacillota bacterium]|nr:aminoglycoside 6-adenylyltransferase [Bacillota bacterium]